MFLKIKELISKKTNICKFFTNKVHEIEDGAQNYYNLIQVPCYLNLILDRLENLYYINFESFVFDINLIQQNTIKYNGMNNPIAELAQKLYLSLLTIFEEVLQTFKINTDFIYQYQYKSDKISVKKAALDDLNATLSVSNKRLLRNNNNSESKNIEFALSINGNKLIEKGDLDSLETKSENEYNESRFNFGGNAAPITKNGNYDFIEEEEKIQENSEVKIKGRRGRKKKISPEEEILASNLNTNPKNIITIENENIMNSIEISNSKGIEDNESSENKASNDNYEIKIDDINKEMNYSCNYNNSNSRRSGNNKRNLNIISIPIEDLKNGDLGRATRNKKIIKYSEINDNLSLDSSKSEKYEKQNIKRRGRPRKDQSTQKLKDDCSCKDYEEEYEKENEEFSVNTRSLGRKRNRQLIKFEFK
jgi:hypothetical protein